MPWTPFVGQAFTGGLVWEDIPDQSTAVSAAHLNQVENATVAHADAVGASVYSSITGQLPDPALIVAPPSAPAEQDLLIRSGGTWARLAIGTTSQELVVRSDGTLKYTDAPTITPKAWGGVADDNTLSAYAVQQAITAAQNTGSEVLIDGKYAVDQQITYDLSKPLRYRNGPNGRLRWTVDKGLAAPTGVLAAAQAGATSFAAQTNYYRVAAVNAAGEGLASVEVNVAIAAGQQVALSWNAVASATGYRVYRGTAAYDEAVYYALGNVTNYVDTNAATSGAAHPPRNGRIYGIAATGDYVDGTYVKFDGPRLVGPGGVLAAAAGVRPALMHGLQLGPKANLEGNFFITGFNAGYAFYGDHQRVIGGASRGNYVGESWEPDPWQAQIGDQLIIGTELTNNALASVYVSPASNEAYKALHQRVHFGFGPIGIYIEGQGAAADAVAESTFDNCYFESISTADVYSENQNNNLTGVAFRDCPGYWSGAPLAGYTGGWNIYNVGVVQDCQFDHCAFLGNVGTVGLLSCSEVLRLEIRMGQAILDNLVGKAILQALFAEGFVIYGRGGAKYLVVQTDTSTLKGDLMQLKTGQPLSASGPYFTRYVAAAVGAQAPIVGVAAQQCPNVIYQTYVPVCVEGRYSGGVRNVAATAAGQFLVPDPANNGAVVSQAGAPGAQVQLVGVSLAAGAANGTTDLLVTSKV